MNKRSKIFRRAVPLLLGLVLTPAVVVAGSNKVERETELNPYVFKVFGSITGGGFFHKVLPQMQKKEFDCIGKQKKPVEDPRYCKRFKKFFKRCCGFTME